MNEFEEMETEELQKILNDLYNELSESDMDIVFKIVEIELELEGRCNI